MKYTAKHLHPATLLSEPFAMDCPVTTDGDYISSQVAVFTTDEDDNNQRVGGLASMPVTNGVRYHAPQSAMQDLQYVIFSLLLSISLQQFQSGLPFVPTRPSFNLMESGTPWSLRFLRSEQLGL